MPGSLSLNGTWRLTWTEGAHLAPPGHYTGVSLRGRGLLEAAVPAPIHQVLQDAGLLDDPNIGLNSLKARWVEEAYWIYRHTFTAPAQAAEEPAWLTFGRLELEATVWLNGEEIGTHDNAHRPAVFNVTGKLKAGENLLVVQLRHGMHGAADKPAEGYSVGHIGVLTKRHWLRHPQYQSGWDWSARLGNIGILGDVTLAWHTPVRLAQAAVFAVPTADFTCAAVTARAVVDNPGDAPVDAVLTARIAETGQETRMAVTLPPGESRHEATVMLEQPKLWWPVGHGEQPLYTVETALECNGERQAMTRRTGVRSISIDQSPHPVEGKYFILRINDRPIFCKGGNWAPADLYYSAVPKERYRALVRLGVEANFNTLRIWGGGPFADPALCEACDEMGVLIWHDFLFACAQYPGHDPAFAAEVRREVTWAVREMAHHPSLVVWCGNNEIEWGDWAWGYDTAPVAHPHYALFHHDIPKILREEDSSTPYWPSSPYSPDYRFPNDPTVGDQHPWSVSIMEPGGADFWHYRALVDRFPNEGGVMGATTPATLRQFLPESERHLLSPSWQHHDNPFACTDAEPGELGRAFKTVQLWTGRDPLAMPWEDYVFASTLLQGEGLREYILNYRRRMFSSASAIFWSYNDSWPVTHGWTIVDYYLRQKLSYHPVRRAFQPVTVVVVEENDQVVVYGVNDTPEPMTGQLRYGLFTPAGAYPMDAAAQVTLAPNASTALVSFPMVEWKALGLANAAAFAVLSVDGRTIAQERLLLARFHEISFVEPAIRLDQHADRLVLTSDSFAWGVCLDVEGEQALPDNCFDLLPGMPYTVYWQASLGEARIVKVGSRDAVGAVRV